MARPFTLFEVSWEICNKVGGIHTVVSSKAKSLVERFGDEYIAVGPWLLSDAEHEAPFDEDDSFGSFTESCRDLGIPVRVGRWRIPGRPRTILVECSSLYDQKDDLLAKLWEDYGVDSISGSWDYVEPVLFGHAAGRVIEAWSEEFLAPHRRRAVVHVHEWMTASALLHLKRHVPSVGTVFTAHATMLGRALSSAGQSPDDGLGDQTALELAEAHGVVAKHSLEGIAAREADAFTTVSEITAREATLLHERSPEPVTPNGIDLDVIDTLADAAPREQVRTTLNNLASRFLGEDVSDAAFLCVSGRYEFHNKGIDVLLDALVRLNGREGRRIVLFALVPAGNSGVRSEYLEREGQSLDQISGPMGISTHNLFDPEQDPIQEHCQRTGLVNDTDSRVKIVQIPIYLDENDGLFGLPYESVLRAMDLSCFPSYYEPWGYTPQESLALGVPTITTDYAGFGRWARNAGLTTKDGITVIERVHVEYEQVTEKLADEIERFLSEGRPAHELEAVCRETAGRTSWSGFLAHYDEAFRIAMEAVQDRAKRGVPHTRRRPRLIPVEARPERERPRLRPFEVQATLPPELEGLARLARNYWWSWDHEAMDLFEELSPRSWEAAKHNPVLFLHRVYPEDLEAKATDAVYLAKLGRVLERFDAYLAQPVEEGRWRQELEQEAQQPSADHPVAYFCAEFGIHESLRVYGGGLGILAGDHLKSASDLNVPLVGIGLFYRMGYMTQELDPSGEQIAVDVENDVRTLPLELLRGDDGEPLEISLNLPSRELHVRCYRVRVGRVLLYLLDSNTPSNRPEDRDVTRNLYGGGPEKRIVQEIILGRAGVKLLRRLGIQPSVYHMNEGHPAFLALERVGQLARKEGLTFDEARELVRATTVFTTHTPVPAGHDRFGEDLVRRYFSDVADWVGVPWERFHAMGRTAEDQGDFNMTYLALHFSSVCNGVSKLHGIASRKLLHPYWPSLLESEVPVQSITNGVHLATWTHPTIEEALDTKESKRPAALWRAKQGLKHKLIEGARGRIERGFLERGDSPDVLGRTLAGLDPDALLIGFARRFAPYKRANLLFQDRDRLRALLENADRPVRILVAGKAHPDDGAGRELLAEIAGYTRDPDFVGKVFFLQDYDIALARLLLQGVDVWLNNPIRMLEASGTSGMKAACNGTLNLSIGDGWWPEAYDGSNGWIIGEGRDYEDQSLQDRLDVGVLYRLLEEEVVPAYFERDGQGFPRAWLERMSRNMLTIPTVFNTDRMVSEYLGRAYLPLAANFHVLAQGKKGELKHLVQEDQRVRRAFEQVHIQGVQVGDLSELVVGDPVDVRVELDLGDLAPEDVIVEFVLGHSTGDGDLQNRVVLALGHLAGSQSPAMFAGAHQMERSGSFSYGIRIRARRPKSRGDSLRDLVIWA
jgi:phosphorylase/glycogen(starch) synthase